MNSLGNEFYTGYKVTTIPVNGYHYPYFTEITNASKSCMSLKLIKQAAPKFDKPFEPTKALQVIKGIQGSLF